MCGRSPLLLSIHRVFLQGTSGGVVSPHVHTHARHASQQQGFPAHIPAPPTHTPRHNHHISPTPAPPFHNSFASSLLLSLSFYKSWSPSFSNPDATTIQSNYSLCGIRARKSNDAGMHAGRQAHRHEGTQAVRQAGTQAGEVILR